MRKSAAVVAAACLILAAQAPHAQTTPQTQSQAAPAPQAQANLAQLVRAAEQHSGGRARKVELENERGVEVYEIKTVSKDKSSCVLIDRVTGKVVRTEGPGFMSGVFDREDQQEEEQEHLPTQREPQARAPICRDSLGNRFQRVVLRLRISDRSR